MRHQHRKPPEELIARPPRGRHSRKIKLGTPYRGIIASATIVEQVAGVAVRREYALHATKGYRSIRE